VTDAIRKGEPNELAQGIGCLALLVPVVLFATASAAFAQAPLLGQPVDSARTQWEAVPHVRGRAAYLPEVPGAHRGSAIHRKCEGSANHCDHAERVSARDPFAGRRTNRGDGSDAA
jgi:hypothetical protein